MIQRTFTPDPGSHLYVLAIVRDEQNGLFTATTERAWWTQTMLLPTGDPVPASLDWVLSNDNQRHEIKLPLLGVVGNVAYYNGNHALLTTALLRHANWFRGISDSDITSYHLPQLAA